jgi:hypothetical protein
VGIDSVHTLDVVIASADNLYDLVLVGLARADTLCYAGMQQTNGVWPAVDARERWDSALATVAPSLVVADAASARQLAAAALSFATGFPVDSMTESDGQAARPRAFEIRCFGRARWVDSGWNVTGVLFMGGRRVFFIRFSHGGELLNLFLQDPADPADSL